MANIVLNSSDLLRVDLDGVMVLLPRIFKAINAILSESTPKIKYVCLLVVTTEVALKFFRYIRKETKSP